MILIDGLLRNDDTTSSSEARTDARRVGNVASQRAGVRGADETSPRYALVHAGGYQGVLICTLQFASIGSKSHHMDPRVVPGYYAQEIRHKFKPCVAFVENYRHPLVDSSWSWEMDSVSRGTHW